MAPYTGVEMSDMAPYWRRNVGYDAILASKSWIEMPANDRELNLLSNATLTVFWGAPWLGIQPLLCFDGRMSPADRRLPTADCRLPTADRRLPTADCRPSSVVRQLGASEPRSLGASEPRSLGVSEARRLGGSEARRLVSLSFRAVNKSIVVFWPGK